MGVVWTGNPLERMGNCFGKASSKSDTTGNDQELASLTPSTVPANKFTCKFITLFMQDTCRPDWGPVHPTNYCRHHMNSRYMHPYYSHPERIWQKPRQNWHHYNSLLCTIFVRSCRVSRVTPRSPGIRTALTVICRIGCLFMHFSWDHSSISSQYLQIECMRLCVRSCVRIQTQIMPIRAASCCLKMRNICSSCTLTFIHKTGTKRKLYPFTWGAEASQSGQKGNHGCRC